MFAWLPAVNEAGRDRMKTIDKVAFLVHEPTMFAHYSSVWAAMPSDSFVIVLLNVFKKNGEEAALGVGRFMSKISALGYSYMYLEDLLSNGLKFKYVVSNHYIAGTSKDTNRWWLIKAAVKRLVNFGLDLVGRKAKYDFRRYDTGQFVSLQVGRKQIRFMYGADIGDGWSLQSWNEIYDLFLCHGPNDEKQLKKRFLGKTLMMGYPRYDEYFNQNLDVGDVLDEFAIDPAKKTILWMSTTGVGASSIPAFAKLISKLFAEYNVIARPHPIAFRAERENIELLESMGYAIDRNVTRNMNKLYRAVDFVLCDFGGSAFSAIYLGKKLILLDVPGADNCAWGSGSSNFDLYGHVPVVTVDDFDKIQSFLVDGRSWDEWEDRSKALSDKYFSDYRGSSAARAAEILNNLDKVL